MRLKTIFILVLFSFLNAREFEVEGSDLLMGIGASPMSKSGAVVASENSVYSVFWNPAGLANIKNHQISISGQGDRKLAPINFLGTAFTLPFEKKNSSCIFIYS